MQALVRGKPGNALPDSPSHEQQQRLRPGAVGRGAAAAAAAAGAAAAGAAAAAADPLDGSRFWREVSGIDDLDEDEEEDGEEEGEEGEAEGEEEEDMPQVGPSRTRGAA